MEQREIADLKKRIEGLERDRDDIAENEKMLLRIAKLNRLDLQETKIRVERMELIQGDTNERLDHIEQALQKQSKFLEHIKGVQADHSERFDRLERRMAGLDERVEGLGERLGRVEDRMGGMDQKLDAILQLLQKSG